MSIQWVAIAGFLYLEIFISVLLMIPFICANRWNKIFKSRFLTRLSSHSTLYFNVLMVVLFVLFLDAIREVIKYNKMEENSLTNPRGEGQSVILMRLFRAQRNLYVSGFAFLMWFILHRIMSLVSRIAQLEAVNEATLKQAKSASDVAQKLMGNSGDKVTNVISMIFKDNDSLDIKEEYEKIKAKLAKAEQDVIKHEMNIVALKEQYGNTNKAYDELLVENEKLQKMINREIQESKKEH